MYCFPKIQMKYIVRNTHIDYFVNIIHRLFSPPGMKGEIPARRLNTTALESFYMLWTVEASRRGT